MHKVRLLIPLLVAACIASSCSRNDREEWREAVRLMNGDSLEVERRNLYSDVGDIVYPQGPLVRSEIKFLYKGKRYEWIKRGVSPLSLQQDDEGRFYVVGYIPYRWACAEWSKTSDFRKGRNLYIAFREAGSSWEELPLEFVPLNVVFNLAGSNRSYYGNEYRSFVPEDDPKKPFHQPGMPDWYREFKPDSPSAHSCF